MTLLPPKSNICRQGWSVLFNNCGLGRSQHEWALNLMLIGITTHSIRVIMEQQALKNVNSCLNTDIYLLSDI